MCYSCDIIVLFDGKPVARIDDLHKYLTGEMVGRTASVGVLRQGRLASIEVIAMEAG